MSGISLRADDPHRIADVQPDCNDRGQDVDVFDDQKEHALLLHRDRRRTDRGPVAVGVLAPDLQLGLIAIYLGDPAPAAIRPPRLVDASIADLESLQRASVAKPVRDQLAQERRLQEAVQDDSRQADAAGEVLVVMDLVEVALCARVLHELARGRLLDQLRNLISGFQTHRLIAVPRRRATGRPCWLTYSVSKMMKSSEPLDPVFS